MTHLRAVPDAPQVPKVVTAADAVEVAPHPPAICIRCGVPTRVTTDTREPTGMHRTFLLCENAHGMAVTWGEN